MKIYGVKYDCNAPSPKKISVPLNSQFQVNFQVKKNGEQIDFTEAGAPVLSVSYNGAQLSSDKFLNKGPVYQIDTGNVATRQSIKAALPGSEFNLFVELTDGDVYEIDEVGGGDVPRDLSVDSIEANDARLDNLNVFSNLSAGQLSVTSGGDSDAITKINGGAIELGMRDGVPTGYVTTNWINLGADEYGGTFEMIGEQFNIKPTERDGQIGNVIFQIDPEDKSEDGNTVAFWNSHVMIGSGGYLDLTQDVPICVNDPTEGTEVNLIPTAVTINGVDYIIMAATATQP